MEPSLAEQVIAHHLHLAGLNIGWSRGRVDRNLPLSLLYRPGAGEILGAKVAVQRGNIVLAMLPSGDFCAAFGVESARSAFAPPVVLEFLPARNSPWRRVRSLHPVHAYGSRDGVMVVRRPDGLAAWLWVPVEGGGLLVCGTDVAADMVRYRQGDSRRASERPTEPLWGIAGERPNYLFEAQLEGEGPFERHADWWAMALAQFLSGKLAVPLAPILPGNAPGAVVITGDDDQAYLEKYAEQLSLLDGAPITYFLHPLTRHTPRSLKKMLSAPGIEIELHPDALDTPESYGEKLADQAGWFQHLTGRSPRLVRNHGFLNDGYWGHLPHWLRHGIVGSSNIPGFDGRVLNGSLLPARVVYGERLTEHWSILTLFGDGILFSGGYSPQQAADKVQEAADRVRSSGLPGVMVINLHPQNVAEAKAMHHAVLDVIRDGFHAWNLGQCLEWFASGSRDASVVARKARSLRGRVRAWVTRKLFAN